MLNALSSLCNRENTDVCIECETSKFYCHSIILKARSNLFFRILEDPSNPNMVAISDVNHNVMEMIIAYIYTGQVKLSRDNLVDVIAASVKLELPNLLEECLKFFRNQINFENAADVLIVAEKFSLTELQKVAVRRITRYRTSLLADPTFRQKMVDHPGILLLLYDELSQEEVSEPAVEVPTSPLWSCLCGSTVSGHYCCWCGGAGHVSDHSLSQFVL